MSQIKAASFRFKSPNFTESHIIRHQLKPAGKLNIQIDPKATLYKEKGEYDLALTVLVKDEPLSFEANITAHGIFAFDPDTSMDSLRPFLEQNAPAILFPYIRAYISTLTAISGVGTVHLPAMNLQSLKETLRGNTDVVAPQ